MAESKKQSTDLATIKKDISVQVLNKINEFQEAEQLKLPADYSVENALKSAYIQLSDPKNNLIEKCTPSSIAEALLKMVVNGVNPIKKQCYFIPYADKLECSISYAGNIAIAKRYGGLKSIKGNAIYKGDTFEFGIDPETGYREIIKHTQSLKSLGTNDIIGAYAVVEMVDGTRDVEVMDIAQIRMAWGQGGSKGNSPAHKNFPDQMAIKTVLNRACKLIISSSDDSALYDPLNEEEIDTTKANVAHKIKQEANQETIDIDAEDVTDLGDGTVADNNTGEVKEKVTEGAGF